MKKIISILSLFVVLIVIILLINKELYKTKTRHDFDSFDQVIQVLSDHKYPLPQKRYEFVYTIVDIEEGQFVINDHISTIKKIDLQKNVGDEFYVLLHENTTIACHWILNDLDNDKIELVNNMILEIPYKGNRDGESNCRRLFHFKTLKEGKDEMLFTYQYYDNTRSDDFADKILFDLTIKEE